MNLVFFGTPDYVTPILDMLHREFKDSDGRSPLVAAVTQPPREAGRDKALSYSGVDTWVFKKNERVKEKSRRIPILFDPEDIIRKKLYADIGILAAYGRILPKKVIDFFPHGIINIHPSLLPELRGASPIQAALATGKEQTGVSFMKMDEEMDHGPILSSFKEEISDTDTLETLRNRSFERSAEVLKTFIPAYIQGKTKLHKQDHSQATFTKIITRDHGFIDWKYLQLTREGKSSDDIFEIPFVYSMEKLESGEMIKKYFTTNYSPETINQYIRALTPWPGVWTQISINGIEKRLKILESFLSEGKLEFAKVQLEGKNEVTWKEFENAYSHIMN